MEQLYILHKFCGFGHLYMDVIYQSQKSLIYILKRGIFKYGLAALQLILVPWNIEVSLVGLIFITNINYSCISICPRQGICEHGMHPHHTLIKAECILSRAYTPSFWHCQWAATLTTDCSFTFGRLNTLSIATVYMACVGCFSRLTCDIDAYTVLKDICHFNEISCYWRIGNREKC